MLIEEAQRRQQELHKNLLEMSKKILDEKELRKKAIIFKSLYTEGFRHTYSEFFPLIVKVSKEGTLEFLSNNLQELRNLVEKDYVDGEKEFEGLYKPLLKLTDHINLEIARYSYYCTSEEKVKDLEKSTVELQQDLKNATEELKVAEKKVSTMQTELIAVLSIFAAIVLAFSGSITFIGNVFSNLNIAPFFKTTFFVLLCGFIVFNTIFVLMYIVSKITGRNIYARCNSLDCTCKEGKVPKCRSVTRLRKRLPYVFWTNVILLSLMLIDLVAWVLNIIYCFV